MGVKNHILQKKDKNQCKCAIVKNIFIIDGKDLT